MKTPHIISFYIYAENAAEVEAAQRAAHSFVKSKYERGKLVTAAKLAEALEKANNNFLISSILTE